MVQTFRLAVGIASLGRAQLLSQTLELIARQVRRPDGVLIAVPAESDVDRAAIAALGLPTEILIAPRGLCAQRNTILGAAGGFDLLTFFDDDFFPQPDYLEKTEALFAAHPTLGVLTGKVLADGVRGPGLSPQAALEILATDRPPRSPTDAPIYNGYGCNMTLRLNRVREAQARFDETLPLYGWLEDVEFCRRVYGDGLILRSDRCRGVHLGVKSGRISGLRLGYSQVANPIYLNRRGAMSLPRILDHMGRNLAANLVRSASPEPWIDRRGRLAGNLMAIGDLLTGKLHPANILQPRFTPKA